MYFIRSNQLTYIPYWYICGLKITSDNISQTQIIKLKKIRRLFILKNYQLYKVYSILNIKVLLYSRGDNKYGRASTGRQFSRLIYKPEQVVGGHIIVLCEGSPSEASARRAHTENRPSAMCSVFWLYPSAPGRDPRAWHGFFVPVSQKISFLLCTVTSLS